MANLDGNMESSRSLAKLDKEKVRKLYQPPEINSFRYCIVDIPLHCRYYYKSKSKYLKNVKRFSRIADAGCRFIFIDSKQQ